MQPAPWANITFYGWMAPGTSGFEANRDCETMYYAMKGSGCDESKLTFLTKLNTQELATLQQLYREKFKKDLVAELSGEVKGHFKNVLMGLFKDPLTFDSDSIHTAMKGVGSDADALVEILVTKNNAEKHLLADHFAKHHSKSLEARVSEETSGEFRSLLLGFLGRREEAAAVVEHNAEEDARQLYFAGEGKTGTDEKKFVNILTKNSFPQVAAIARHYPAMNKKHHTLAQAIESEFSGALRTGLLAVVTVAEWGIIDYYAELAYKAMKGLGTNDEKLVRVLLINRNRPNMEALKVQYKKKYGKSLKEAVHSETSGTYRESLMNLIGDT